MKKLIIGSLLVLSTSAFSAQFNIGEGVITSSGKQGVVRAIFNSNTYMVKVDRKSRLQKERSYELGKVYGCAGVGFCVGDTVVTSRGKSGIVKGVFDDGNVAVKFRRSRSLVICHSSDLAVTQVYGSRTQQVTSDIVTPFHVQQNYNFDYNSAARDIGVRVVSLVKTLEPYANNADEVQLDDIKKKAAKLIAKSSSRSYERVAAAAIQLEGLLNTNEDYLFDLLETDSLDGLSIELITLSENLSELLDHGNQTQQVQDHDRQDLY